MGFSRVSGLNPYFAYELPDADVFLFIDIFILLLYGIAAIIGFSKVSTKFMSWFSFSNLIYTYVFGEFLFLLSNLTLDFSSQGLTDTLAFHGVLEAFISFRVLLSYNDSINLCVKLTLLWFIYIVMCVSMYYPLRSLGLGSFILFADILVGVAGLTMASRGTRLSKQLSNDSGSGKKDNGDDNNASEESLQSLNKKAIFYGYVWTYHCISSAIIFFVFFMQYDYGFVLLIHATHQVIYIYLSIPFTALNESTLAKIGVSRYDGFDNKLQLRDSLLNNDDDNNDESNKNDSNNDNNLTFLEKRTKSIMSTIMFTMGLFIVYFAIILCCSIGFGRMEMIDLIESPFDYYYPGGIGAVKD